MQKIFYNARFLTMNEKFDEAEAMLVNNDSIVFVGSKDEVFNLKTDETELIDLNDGCVVPTFYDLNLNIYHMIEKELKNANLDDFIEKINEKDENYEIFCNYDQYRGEFLKIQNKLLSFGITTIQEHISSKSEFVFWKKISESSDLKIDVIGYVNFVKDKQIMDDNCRSFRKYKNHFRLGGYYVELDGSILQKKAFLKKPYPKENKYCGFSEIGYEQLEFIIKTALEEKKQLIVKADGNRAVEEFLDCYQEYISKSKVEDNFRPIIFGCYFLSKATLKKIEKLNLICNFNIGNLIDSQNEMKNIFGKRKLKKIFPINNLLKNDTKFLCYNSQDKIFDSFFVYGLFTDFQQKNILRLKKQTENHCFKILKRLICEPAYYCFDFDQKGTFESGKRANFLVLDKNINTKDKVDVLNIYLDGVLIYSK